MNIFSIIHNPKNTFSQINKNADWFRDYIILSFLLILLAFFMKPINYQIYNNIEAFKKLSEDQIELLKNISSKLKYIGLIFVPIIFIIKTLLITVLLYIGVSLSNGRKVFKEFFALTIAASIITVLSNIVNIFILYSKGIQNIKTKFDLYPLGLNSLFDINKIGTSLYLFLTNINIFDIWYIVILIFGVSEIAKIDKRKASFIVVISWFIILSFNTIKMLI